MRFAAALIWIVAALLIACSSDSTLPAPQVGNETSTASDTSNGFYMGGQTTTGNDPLNLDSDDSIKHNTNHQDADLQFRTLGTQPDHKVDGSL